MNAKSVLIVTLTTLVAATAFANGKGAAELQQEAQLRQPSTVSRATVLAELAQARADGTLDVHPDRADPSSFRPAVPMPRMARVSQ